MAEDAADPYVEHFHHYPRVCELPAWGRPSHRRINDFSQTLTITLAG